MIAQLLTERDNLNAMIRPISLSLTMERESRTPFEKIVADVLWQMICRRQEIDAEIATYERDACPTEPLYGTLEELHEKPADRSGWMIMELLGARYIELAA